MNKILTFIFLSSLLFAEEAPVRKTGYINSLIMILLAVVFFYFILWRPEQKRRKAAQAQRESLKVGDKVTAMGIIGIVDKVEKDTIVLRTLDNSKIEILKAAVTEVKSQETEESSAKK